jgi:biotin-dependent carboxylase-like uncharacterized protein
MTGGVAVLTVLAAGPMCTIQDLGRPALGHLGIGESGGADRYSLRLANRLVGNPDGTAAVEVTLGGLAVRADRPITIAVTGPPAPVRAGGRSVDQYCPVFLPAGVPLSIGAPAHGLRNYLAVRGGLAVPPVLGSCSRDTLAGVGPEPLTAGTAFPIGTPPLGDVPALDLGCAPQPRLGTPAVLSIRPGPRDDWFTAGALQRLTGSEWTVTADADRVGVRLSGPRLERRPAGELPPEPTVTGALQVPPDGRPILFLADHPVTGGYPVIGCLDDDSCDRAAQLRPGEPVVLTLSPGPPLERPVGPAPRP